MSEDLQPTPTEPVFPEGVEPRDIDKYETREGEETYVPKSEALKGSVLENEVQTAIKILDACVEVCDDLIREGKSNRLVTKEQLKNNIEHLTVDVVAKNAGQTAEIPFGTIHGATQASNIMNAPFEQQRMIDYVVDKVCKRANESQGGLYPASILDACDYLTKSIMQDHDRTQQAVAAAKRIIEQN